MVRPLSIAIDRSAVRSLADQIYAALATAIRDGRLPVATRLPSWRDLASQLGVARGTIRVAYERLIDEQLAVGRGAAGTWVAHPVAPPAANAPGPVVELPAFFPATDKPPRPFELGVPAHDAFPAKQWSRIMARAARTTAAAPLSYADPRGCSDLRREIAAYLSIARGLSCTASQVFVSNGYAGALGLAIHALRLSGVAAWMEEPGFALTRTALTTAGITVTAVPVDDEGLEVATGVRLAPRARLAVVTPGQQAPLGMTLSLARRVALLAWAEQVGAWVIEDDYLGELQLKGRAAPALASLDRQGRVLHIGSFSKTITPSLRLGFIVVPPDAISKFTVAAACLAPASAVASQHAVADFMAHGHFLRHLRRMRRLYGSRRELLQKTLIATLPRGVAIAARGGLAVQLIFNHKKDDTKLARQALALGLAPHPLSVWYAARPVSGLLLGVTNVSERHVADDCAGLISLLRS